MKRSRISVIIPVYNASLYLKKCLESLREQSCSDFEAILVNDGSTDDSENICREFVSIDPRFVLLNQANRGASAARNSGIEVAQSEYICFSDADDELSSKYLEHLLRDIDKNNGIDLVIQGFVQSIGHETRVFGLDDKVYDMSKSGLDDLFSSFDVSAYSGPCCKVFKKKIIDNANLRFSNDIIYREDFDFLIRYLLYCNKITTSAATNYNYILRQGSVSTNFYSFDKEYSGLKQLFLSFSKLYEAYNSKEVINIRNHITSDYLRRAITSMYVNPTNRRFRLDNYRQIDSKYIDVTIGDSSFKTPFLKLIRFLLSHHQYVLLDSAMYLRIRH